MFFKLKEGVLNKILGIAFKKAGNIRKLEKEIKILLDNQKLKNELIIKGFEQVKKYSWKKTAEETLDVYAKV